MKIMTFLGNIFHWLTTPFENLLNAAESAFNHLSADEQLALKRASSFVAVLTQVDNLAPDFVFNTLNKLSPGLTKDRFEKLLNTVATTLSVSGELVGKDLPTTLQNVSSYLNKYQGKKWVVAVQSAVGFILSEMTPEGTVIEKLLMCLQFVYTHWVSKQIKDIKVAA